MNLGLKAFCLSTSLACLPFPMNAVAHAQTVPVISQTPLSDVDCDGNGGYAPAICRTTGTRNVTFLSEEVGNGLSRIYQVNFDGTLAVDGIVTGPFGGLDPSNFYSAATVDLTTQYIGRKSRSLTPINDPNAIGYFNRYSDYQTTVRNIGVDIQGASGYDETTGQDYSYNLKSIDPSAIVNGDRTALTGNYRTTSDAGAIVFGTLSGDAVLVSAPSLSPLPIPDSAVFSPFSLQYQVAAQETTRLDETGLVTPKVSVTQGIEMNGSGIHDLADGVAAGDAVNKGQLDSEAAARIAADSTLAGRIDEEKAARIDADIALASSIANEAGTRAAADSVLANSISAEAATRQAADVTLSGQIIDEAQQRAQNDLQIHQRIDNETSAREALASALTGETNARMTADLQLSSRIDALGDRLDQIDGRLDRMEDRVSSGTAVAVAMGGATFLPDMKFNLTANVATYGGAHAGAMQVGALVTPHVALNAGVATGFNRGGKTAARAGFTIGW